MAWCGFFKEPMNRHSFVRIAMVMLLWAASAHADITAYTEDPAGFVSTVTVDGTTHNSSTLINGTMAGFVDPNAVQLLVGDGNSVPAASSRAGLASDLCHLTGILNISGSFTYTFDAAVINRPGIDLLIWDWGAFANDNFGLTINGQTVNIGDQDTASSTTYTMSVGARGSYFFYNNSVTSDFFTSDDAKGVGTVAAMEALAFTGAKSDTSASRHGVIGIDLSDFGVGSGASITSLTISVGTGTVDPTIILGLPEPPPPPPTDPRPNWDEFRAANFGPAVTADANPYTDPDGNGLINLFEHAFGEDTSTPGKFNQPLVDFSTVPDSVTLSYPKAAKDVDYFAEWSPDLSPGSWSRLGFSSETQDPVSEWFSRTIQHDPPLPRQFLRMGVGIQDPANLAAYPKANGFRGIWFYLNQPLAYGYKYSGGLGTYTANHVPMAHYVPEVNRTYFTWGGTPSGTEKLLHILVSYFDHNTGLVARPVLVMDKSPVNDPHDNASMSIDEEGYIWIFVSGRGTIRLGRIYRSKVPFGINDWVTLGDSEFTYPQPWWFKDKGFLHAYTRYTNGRELYCRSSRNGTAWNAEKKLAGIGGHYQTSSQVGDRLITAFNRHPNGSVDARTDLYYMETADMGETWTTAAGTVLTTPLTTAANPARIRNYSTNASPADNALVYIHDTTADADGHPVILYITAKDYQPGPSGDPRTWMIARWTGTEWLFHAITTSTHNYDTGSIYIEEDGTWKVIGPIGSGPQFWGAGGEIEVWISADQGASWVKQRDVTSNSPRNHSYARRPRNAHPDFYCYWADGNADALSESHLYFTNKTGDKVWSLPYDMSEDFAAPVLVEP
jgi:hypothetical protein